MGSCDTANKENKLACAGHLPEKICHDSGKYLVNSSDLVLCKQEVQHQNKTQCVICFFPEISQDHEIMAQVLFSRNLRLNVALTFWKKSSMSKMGHWFGGTNLGSCGTLPSCVHPQFTGRTTSLALGCYADLLLLVTSLLKNKFENTQ